MAKNSMIEREKKRTKVVLKYAVKRTALKAIINDRNAPIPDIALEREGATQIS